MMDSLSIEHGVTRNFLMTGLPNTSEKTRLQSDAIEAPAQSLIILYLEYNIRYLAPDFSKSISIA